MNKITVKSRFALEIFDTKYKKNRERENELYVFQVETYNDKIY